ncbi:MAG: 50S ribosomal protein L11 methyltransferase [Bacteroidales bacterium]|nr:50S ribosomal protein L11 methyltransferase [Bacteroidales bacterium]
MNYFEFSFNTIENAQTEEDIAIAFLGESGYESFMNENNILKSYIKESDYNEPELTNFIKDFAITNSQLQFIKQENWNAEWESNLHPVIIDKECIIKASFHDIQESYKYEIIIDPKMSFGTGHHETTSLMCKEILELDFTGKEVADCGCGTGILAILASMKGAENILAFDIDEWSCENTKENIIRNSIKNIAVELAGVEILKANYYDILLANINKNTILNSINTLSNALKNNGILLLSGIYISDIETIVNEAMKHSLTLVHSNEKNKWASCLMLKNN